MAQQPHQGDAGARGLEIAGHREAPIEDAPIIARYGHPPVADRTPRHPDPVRVPKKARATLAGDAGRADTTLVERLRRDSDVEGAVRDRERGFGPGSGEAESRPGERPRDVGRGNSGDSH